jgi:hypothetical protein
MVTLSAHTRRSEAAIRSSLIWLELLVGIGAIYGAVMLVTDAWHLQVSDLRPLPLHSWVIPGLALFAVVTVPMIAAAIAIYRGVRHAADLSLAAGLLLVGWIGVQVLVIGPQMWLQPAMLIGGLAIAGLAWYWRPPVNRVVLWLLRSPARGLLDRHVCGLRFIGRHTGATVELPVGFVRDGDRLLVLVARASAKRWWRNFRDVSHGLEVTLAGTTRDGEALALGPGDRGYADAMSAYRRQGRRPADRDHELVLIELVN